MGWSEVMVVDSVLLDRYVRNGDPEAFAELVRRYAGLVYGTCLRATGNPQDAEDVAQECFLELARKANRIGSSMPGWLHSVARNRSIDMVRGAARRRAREEKSMTETNENYEPAWADIVPYVDEALEALPEPLKAIVLLHYFDGLSQKEVAERLDVSQPTVSRALDKSISMLRKHLAKTGIFASAAILATLLRSNAVSAAPQTLVISATKIGLSGISQTSIPLSCSASAVRGVLPGKTVGVFVAIGGHALKTKLAIGISILLLSAGLIFWYVGIRHQPLGQSVAVPQQVQPLSKQAEEQLKAQVLSQGKSLGVALLVYAGKHGWNLPPADATPDVLGPVIKNAAPWNKSQSVFVSPQTGKRIFNYRPVGNLRNCPNPETTVIGTLDAGYGWKVDINAGGVATLVNKQR